MGCKLWIYVRNGLRLQSLTQTLYALQYMVYTLWFTLYGLQYCLVFMTSRVFRTIFLRVRKMFDGIHHGIK